MKSTVREIIPKVYLFTCDSQYELCMTFVRAQEFYESPEFKNSYFTLEEFIDWWSLNMAKKEGTFDYPSMWGGFNIPGHCLLEWLKACGFRKLRDKEINLLTLLCKKLKIDMRNKVYSVPDGPRKGIEFYYALKDLIEEAYLIGCYRCTPRKKKSVVNHEVAHAMYSLYPDYKESCLKLINAMGSEKDEAAEKIIKRGYDESVLNDELQAYFSTGKKFGIQSQFVENFERFKGIIK